MVVHGVISMAASELWNFVLVYAASFTAHLCSAKQAMDMKIENVHRERPVRKGPITDDSQQSELSAVVLSKAAVSVMITDN